MKNLLHTWINNLNRPSPDTLDHGQDVPKHYDCPPTVHGEVIQKFTDLLLATADTADQYVNDSENWWDREEVEWQAGYRDALLNSVEALRHLINCNTESLDMSLVETLFAKS